MHMNDPEIRDSRSGRNSIICVYAIIVLTGYDMPRVNIRKYCAFKVLNNSMPKKVPIYAMPPTRNTTFLPYLSLIGEKIKELIRKPAK